MKDGDRAHQIRLARQELGETKGFRAARLPTMKPTNSLGFSTKPWGASRMYGVGLRQYSGPSRESMDAWRRATGQTTSIQRRRRQLFKNPRF